MPYAGAMSYRSPGDREPDEPPPDPRGSWVLQTWVSRRVCPDCGVLLFAARRDAYRVDACGSCGGAWLGHEEARRAFEERSLAPALLADEAAKRAERRASRGTRSCPECREELAPTDVRDAGVVIDVCASHGAWYDPGELRRVITAVAKRRPIPIDPDVEHAIAQAARQGAYRPPADYEPGRGHPLSVLDALDMLLDAALAPRAKRPDE